MFVEVHSSLVLSVMARQGTGIEHSYHVRSVRSVDCTLVETMDDGQISVRRVSQAHSKLGGATRAGIIIILGWARGLSEIDSLIGVPLGYLAGIKDERCFLAGIKDDRP
ncbi:hypothetical protein OROGR_021155 [Orobanche gracilis]